jgi:hypothetical protein
LFMRIYPHILDEISSRRAEVINDASANGMSHHSFTIYLDSLVRGVESQAMLREQSRKKLLKAAKANFLQGLEQQKVLRISCMKEPGVLIARRR